ncbi:unnamed protein product [Camellia sinensis]
MSHFSPVAWTLKKTIVEFEGDFLVKRFFVTDSHENKIEDGEYERDRGEESWVSGGDAGDRKVLTREGHSNTPESRSGSLRYALRSSLEPLEPRINGTSASEIEYTSASKTEDSESKEFVLNLDHSNFHETIGKHDFIVIEFYAPWYGNYKKLAAEYEKATSVLSSHDPPVTLAKKIYASDDMNKGRLCIEAQINNELCDKFSVGHYPMLLRAPPNKFVAGGWKPNQDKR